MTGKLPKIERDIDFSADRNAQKKNNLPAYIFVLKRENILIVMLINL